MRIEHGPAELDFHTPSTTYLQALPPSSKRIERGGKRLVVDMPAQSPRWLLFAIVYAVTWLAPLAVIRAIEGELDPGAVILFAFIALAAVTIMAFRLFSSREVLEVDSRIVSLRRGVRLLYWTCRRSCTQVMVIPQPRAGFGEWIARQLMGVPQLRLGTDTQTCGVAGFGISREAAERLIPVIEEFLADVPPDEQRDGA